MLVTKLKRALETAANVAIIAICIALIVPLVGRYLTPIFEHDVGDSGLHVGATFPQLPNVSYSDHRATVVLFLNTRCVACRQSMPDYDGLRLLVGAGKESPVVYGVFTATETTQAIAEIQFRLPTIRVNAFDDYHVYGTPTIVLVDRTGKVRDFWVGKLTSNSQINLVRLVKEI